MRLRSFSLALVILAFAAGWVGLAGCGSEGPTGVLLIVVDTLRADRLGTYGYDGGATPELDRWAAEGALFEKAYATSPWTLPTFGSILTGRLPATHGAGRRLPERDWKLSRRLLAGVPTLAEILKGEGYSTAAVINNPWLRPHSGMNRGFEQYDYQTASNSKHRRADEIVDLTLAQIEAFGNRPFFLLSHLFDPHLVYDPPPSVRGRFTGRWQGRFRLPVMRINHLRARAPSMSKDERAFVSAAYDEEVAFVDQELGRLFAELRARDQLGRLLVLLTSDHGEELFDHDGFEHGHSVYQELLHIPLIAWGSGVRAGRIPQAVSALDLAPTILEALGVEPTSDLAGQSLWPTLTRRKSPSARPIIAEGTLYGPERRALIEWPYKLEHEPETGRQRLFDLASDPRELHDLAQATAAVADRMESRLRQLLAAAQGPIDSVEEPLDEKTLQELRSLGYLQ